MFDPPSGLAHRTLPLAHSWRNEGLITNWPLAGEVPGTGVDAMALFLTAEQQEQRSPHNALVSLRLIVTNIVEDAILALLPPSTSINKV
jgi:hypothetical protein